jgi:hypothetical protein
MRQRLDVDASTPVATPALGLFARPDAVLSAWVRPWRLRPLAAWSGGAEVVRALAVVAEDQRALLSARGMQLVLASELLMTDDGAELDDAAMSLVVDRGVLRLRSVQSLTAEGEAILEAASKGASETYAVAVDDAWIDAALRADARAMLEATEPPPTLAAAKTASEMAEALADGGSMAMAYMGLRHPFGLLRLVDRWARTERLPLPIDVLPTAAQVVWRGKDGDVPRVVLSVQWPESYVDRPLAGMVPIAKAEPGFESLRMDTLAPYGRPITVFGLGGEGAGTFDTSQGDRFAGLLRARVSLARIGADVATHDPERGAMLMAAGQVQVTVERRDGALVSEVAWAPGSGGAVAAVAVPVLPGERRPVPMGALVDDGTRCLAKAGRIVADGLDALALVAGDRLGTVVGRALEQSDAPLRCAAEAAGTAEAAKGLRRLLVRVAVEVMQAQEQGAAARTLLRSECAATEDEAICQRAKR